MKVHPAPACVNCLAVYPMMPAHLDDFVLSAGQICSDQKLVRNSQRIRIRHSLKK